MSTTTPQNPSSSQPTLDAASRAQILHNVSLGALIVCPIIILLPPRKFDIYTIALLTGTALGGNQILQERTGRSLVTRWQETLQKTSTGSLPPKALETQEAIRRERAAQHEEKLRRERYAVDGQKDGVLGEIERRKEEEKEKARNLLEKVWMGSEGEDWKSKRDQREKEALEDGRGYGGLIMDQIWEVWNWGKDKTEEVREKDEEVLEERRNAVEWKRK